ncbi:hypothetical protein HDU88_007849 [Geranomyces variabilis]|nr:hypothetical protein HDU88_007849 [Geranomyces variabilis]
MAFDNLELANMAIENLEVAGFILLAVLALKFTLDNSSRLGKIVTATNAAHLAYYIIVPGFACLNRDLIAHDDEEDDKYLYLGLMSNLFIGTVCMIVNLAVYASVSDKTSFAALYMFVVGICSPFLGDIFGIVVNVLSPF